MKFFYIVAAAFISTVMLVSECARAEDADLEQVRESIKKHKERSLEERQTLYKLHQAERQQLKIIRELRDWAVMRFDDPLTPDGPKFPNRSVRVARFHELRAGVISHLVNLPVNESTGKIWSGNGLNALQECLGAAALQHEMYLRQFAMIPQNSLTSDQKERVEILQSMSRGLTIAPALLSNIQCSQGLTGQLLPIKLTFSENVEMHILPLDWPAYFRTEPEFKKYLDAVAKAKGDCIEAAGTGNFEPSERLMSAVDDLDRRISSVQKFHILGQSTRSSNDSVSAIGTTTREIQRARNFVKTLRYSVARFIEIDSFPKAEEFLIQESKLNNPGEQVSLITILAAMEERGLKFAPASRSSEAAHQVIFERMRDYYGSLYGLSLAVKEQEDTVADVEKSIANVERQIADAHRTERFKSVAELALQALKSIGHGISSVLQKKDSP